MNKSYFTVLILFFFCAFGWAQNKNIVFGIKGGLNYSNYTPDLEIGGRLVTDYKYRSGYFGGAFVNFPIKEKLSIQTELLFSLHGAGIRDENVPITNEFGNVVGVIREFKFNINESTILLPVNLQYHISNKLYVEGGIQIGYIFKTLQKIDSKTKSELSNFLNVNVEDIELNDFDALDIGFDIGFGYHITEKVDANFRYFLGANKRNDTVHSSIFSLGLQFQIFKH